MCLSLADKLQICILSYDEASGRIRTEATGQAGRKTGGRRTQRGGLALVDPDSSVLVLHVYDGLLTLMPLAGSFSEEVGVPRFHDLPS